MNLFYFLLTEGMTPKQRDEIDALLLAGTPMGRRTRVAQVQGVGGEVIGGRR